ncbi:hypothetical protein [Streptomyces acidiscabies]|uniref:hypothetical protein n=1 Tax=Streptomyces acidiscabies TaxID=42234 RepID=UPI00117C1BE3|nr:hypothetical protein [Streptomyces acidiscabies]
MRIRTEAARVRKAVAVAAVAAALFAGPATAAHADGGDPPAAPAASAQPSAAPSDAPSDAPADPSAQPSDGASDAPKESVPESTTDHAPPAPTSEEQPTQQLDKIAQDHAALGVFGDASAPVLVLPAGTSADEQAQVTAQVPADAHATVKASQFTQADLDSLGKTVTDRQWAPEAGTYAVSTEYDAQSDKLRVRSDAPDSALQQLSDAHPGQLETSQSRMEPQNTRFADWSPFWGGNALIGATGGGQCTGGVAVKDWPGGDKLLTSAHCYGWWVNVYNRNYSGGANSNSYVGKVYKRDTDVDAEELSGTDYAPIIYTGGSAISGSHVRVFGKQPVYFGLQVCVSGAVSFNHCGHPISNGQFNICWSGTDVCIKNNTGFVFEKGGTNFPNYNNGLETKPGDSGAPIYITDRSGIAAYIVGLNAGAVWDNCCGRRTIHMVGVKLDDILAKFGSDLITTS